MKRESLTVMVAALALTLSACGGGGSGNGDVPEQEEAAPGFLAVADESSEVEGPVSIQLAFDQAEAGGYDPQMAALGQSWSIFGLVYEPLVDVDENFEIVPRLASSWEQPDDTTYVFTIDTSAKFSNGRAVTVEDVVGSLDRLRASDSQWVEHVARIDSVTALDDQRVEVKLSEPYTPLLAALANNPASILPMQEVEAGKIDLTKEMLGTGPFVVESHRQDKEWVFARNPHYRDLDEVRISELRLEFAGNDATRQAALREGSVAMTTFKGVDALDLMADSDASMYIQQQTGFFYFAMNSLREGTPLADQDLRFAINAAVDREALSDAVFAGQGKATGITPSNLPGACDAADLPSAQLSQDEIVELVESSDYAGETLGLLIYNVNPALNQVAQVVQQQLDAVGVKVKIEQVDLATYLQRGQPTPAEYDLTLGTLAGYSDPAMVARFWRSDSDVSSHFSEKHDDLDELIARAASEPVGPSRTEILADLCRTVDEYSDWVTLIHQPIVYGVNEDQFTLDIATDEGYESILRHLSTGRLTKVAD